MVIAMLGNVFSPYYARQRALGPADPLEHCTVNVAYYGADRSHWALEEKKAHAVHRSEETLTIGSSALSLDGNELTLQLDERTAPFGGRLRGEIRVQSSGWRDETFVLDEAGRHSWTPLALHGRASVQLELPAAKSWSGHAYVDTNHGVEPLECGFRRWDWSRSTGRGETHVVYDVVRRDGSTASIRRSFLEDGRSRYLDDVGTASLPGTFWRVKRTVPTDAGGSPRVLRSLEDTPFYARTIATASLHGHATQWVHETVDLDRFRSGWVQFLVPFRMRRAA